jgi:phage shock protein A
MLRGILMGVLERIENIIRANLSDLLEKPGDPEKLLGRFISEMESELADARAQIAAAIREGKRLNALCIAEEQSAEKWHKKAVLAVQHGKDNLAKEALLRKRAVSTLAKDYRRECSLNEEVVVSLKSALKALEAKIQEAKREKNELIMRKRQIEVDRLLGRDSLADKRATLERMEDKVISLSAEVEVMEEFNGDNLATRLREEELDAELAKLKDRMKSEKS